MNARFVITVLLALPLVACAPAKFTGGTPTEKTRALDGVKYISTSIGRGDDERSYGQRRYTISENARVLLRFESLMAKQSDILTTQPIYIRVFTPDAAEQANAVANLRACPILEDWMIAATWKAAHPYRGGEWKEGAPIEDDECVAPIDPATAPGDCAEANAVCFNVVSWFKHYVDERGINFGHALVSPSGAPITILGDGSHSKGPRIQWSE